MAQAASLSQLKAFAMYPNLLLSDRTFYATTSATTKNRKVFQWYLTNLSGYGGTSAAGSNTAPNPFWPNSPAPAEAGVRNYMQEIAMAQAAGYDGFVLDEWAQDVGALSDNDKANVSAIFEAARLMATGFKLYFALDDDPSNPSKAANYIYLMETYSNHPNYFVRKGRPVLSGYGADFVESTGDASAQWWANQVIAPLESLPTPINVYFVPTQTGGLNFSGGCGDQTKAWFMAGLTISGISDWQIQTAPLGNGLSCLQQFAASAHSARISWVATFSWHYWVQALNSIPGWCAQRCSAGEYFEHGGGVGLDASWRSILNTEAPDWVVELTANDYQESYSESIDDYAKYMTNPGNGIAWETPLGWYKPQSGMAMLAKYYIQWYKSSVKPIITTNSIFYDYLTVPLASKITTKNLFSATIGDGHGGTGNLMTVTAVRQGFVVPGEIVKFNGGASATIVSQYSGANYGPGVYFISAAAHAFSQSMSSTYFATAPSAETFGQTPNSLYVTVSATQDNTVFSSNAGSGEYKQAVVDGGTVQLPVTLSAGLHQIVIASYQLGAQNFELSSNGAVVTSVTGPPILASSPFYDPRDVSGFGM